MSQPAALLQSPLTSLPFLHRGKVRDLYAVGEDKLLVVQTDRLSAFDVILPTPIPGKGQVLTLYKASSTKIKRHIKVRGAANPYDSDYTRYFESRRPKRRRWSQTAGNAPTPQSSGATRTVAHWLQFAAACPQQGAPVGAA